MFDFQAVTSQISVAFPFLGAIVVQGASYINTDYWPHSQAMCCTTKVPSYVTQGHGTAYSRIL
jgi:hypothetical protein